MPTLVVGGYGSVGRVICRELVDSSEHSDEVRVAGRDRRSAESLATRLGDDAAGVSLDVGDSRPFYRALADVDRVVVCVDQVDTPFVEACFDRGIDYVDVTASDEFFRRVEELDERARTVGSTVLLSVGLAPGPTNLLAAHAAERLDAVRSIHVGVLLGLGEAFGQAASRWTLERIGRSFEPERGGPDGPVRGFTDPRMVSFPSFGRRTAYRFDIADQHVLARTLGVPEVATRLCFDSRLVTSLARSGTYPWLLDAVGPDRLARSLEAITVGSDGFAIVVEVSGGADATPRYYSTSITGSEQSRATGLVAARTVETLASDELPSGVHHTHEVIDLRSVVPVLRERGYRLSGIGEAGRATDEAGGTGITDSTSP